MRLASLFSGGKDSMMALYVMEQQGHETPYLLNVVPQREDSMVFHTPNLHLMPLMAESLGRRLVQVRGGRSEGEDLASLSKALEGLDIDGVITGALASDYQWDRINRVCDELGLRTMSPLWRKDQSMIMDELVDSGVASVIVAVMAEGLRAQWLGRALDADAVRELRTLSERYGLNIAGEGGEYETLTLDSPLHQRPLVLDGSEVDERRDSALLTVTAAHLGER